MVPREIYDALQLLLGALMLDYQTPLAIRQQADALATKLADCADHPRSGLYFVPAVTA